MAHVTILPPERRSKSTHRSGSRRARMERLEALANIMDSAVVLPGTNISVGLDSVIGVAPGIGDAVTTLVALYIVKEAHEMGVPKHVVTRMVGNVAIDGLVGAVPLLGDAFDVLFRANRRNMKLLRDHFDKHGWE